LIISLFCFPNFIANNNSMARIRIQLPDFFSFSCRIPVRITDINYGGHAGNDTVLSIIHEARMQYLKSKGYSEMEFAGVGMIMSDVAIQFKNELFYGDIIEASVVAGEISRIGFDLLYKLETLRPANNDQKVLIATAKTGMICYDYKNKKIVSVPTEARIKLEH
jgi:acyl-CoA thioester hydrolase